MPPTPTYDCGHERRPGTTVCLQCRQQALSSAARRQRRTLALVGGAVALVAVVMAGISLGGNRTAPVPDSEPTAIQAGESVSAFSVDSVTQAVPAAAVDTAGAPSPEALRRTLAGGIIPRVAEGRTDLGSGIFAVRSGDTVVVHFDTPEARTRRRDKFQRTLRTTLRQVYGGRIDSVLAAQGDLLGGRDLLRDVSRTGIRLPLPEGGGVIAVWPRTRLGEDGPLVVSYVATLSR